MSSSGPLYKIYTAAQWAACRAGTQLVRAPVDDADGFIHLSAPSQVRGTATKWFAGQADLVLVALDREALESCDLRWEPARVGELFPHVYGAISTKAVLTAVALSDAEGNFAFPPDLPEA